MFYIHLTLNHGLVLKKVHGKIKFIQNAWLKLYIDTDLKKTKNVFEKYGKCKKTIEILNMSQQNEVEIFDIRTKLLYDKIFHRNFICNRNEKKKQKINMDKPVYLGLSVLES